jgi:hypothetical protein
VESLPDWMNNIRDAADDADEVRESERSWRDPSAHRIRSALAKWCADDAFRMQLVRVCGAYDVLAEGNLNFVNYRISYHKSDSTASPLNYNSLSL